MINNRMIKLIESLKTNKGRTEQNKFIIEGEKFVKEIPADWKVEFLIFSESYGREISSYSTIQKLQNEYNCYFVKDQIFKKLSDTVTPQGILAVCEKKQYVLERLLEKENIFLVIAEDLRDPGNVGTVLRTADAAGCDLLIFLEGCIDIYNPKTVRATAGSIFHIPFIENADLTETIKTIKAKKIKLIATHLKGNTYPYAVDLNEGLGILVGNEGRGLSEEIARQADILVKLPMIGQAESLNASIACGIMLYEVVRQRIKK